MHQRPPLRQTPSESLLPDPLQHTHWYGEIWFKFPSAPTLFSAHLSHYVKAKLELWCIAREMASHTHECQVKETEISTGQVLGILQQTQTLEC